MKTITLVLVLFISAALRAEDPTVASHFSYPNAVLRFDGLINGKLTPSANFSREDNTAGPKWNFRSSASVELASKKEMTVSWEFITRSEYGDIYVVSFTDQDMMRVSVPLIFDGEHTVSADRNGIGVSIAAE